MKKKKKILISIIILIVTIDLVILIKRLNIKKTEAKEISADISTNTINLDEELNIVSNESVNNTNEIKEVSNNSNTNAVTKPATTKKKTSTKNNTNNSADSSNVKETYIKGILLVNKKYPLPSTYNPGVNTTAKGKFEEMRKEAAEDGIKLTIGSGFRSYSTQKTIYSRNVSKHGEKIANRFSAKAGQSEHQTGLAFDMNQANRSFVGTKEAKWLKDNCYKYGFIIRYPENKESITGYVYEPWHIRYVGTEVAKEIYEKEICLEEYLGVN